MEFVKVIEHGVESTCEVLHRFSDVRVLVRYDGAVIFADRFSPTEWELSGIPAVPGTEKEVFDRIMKTIVQEGTTVTVTNLQNKVD